MAKRHPRTASVTVLLTENEKRHLDRVASREDKSISSWLREVVVAELVRQAREEEARGKIA